MPRSLLALPILLLPAAAPAQEGPSFDCGYASTRTEIAICASPELARLERQMFQAYQDLVGVIGQPEARRVADDLLARRQACEGDPACIAERLLISMEVFDQRAGRSPDLADLGDLIRERRAQAGLAQPAPSVATAEPPPVVPAPPVIAGAPPVRQTPSTPPAAGLDSDLPLAAQAPWPEGDLPASRDLSDALDGAELASSDAAAGDPDAQAPFDTPLSWAFMDLSREERAAIQGRLAQAGFLDGAAEGAWTNATLAALERFVEEEGSGSFDLSTETGAALLLDYIASEAFARAFGTGPDDAAPDAARIAAPVAATPRPVPAAPPTPLGTGDPLAGTDW